MYKNAKHDDMDSLVREIMRYFEDHPNASDSVQGIAKWWLKHQRYVETTEQVEQALDLLVKKGKLQRIQAPDSTVIYAYSKAECE